MGARRRTAHRTSDGGLLWCRPEANLGAAVGNPADGVHVPSEKEHIMEEKQQAQEVLLVVDLGDAKSVTKGPFTLQVVEDSVGLIYREQP